MAWLLLIRKTPSTESNIRITFQPGLSEPSTELDCQLRVWSMSESIGKWCILAIYILHPWRSQGSVLSTILVFLYIRQNKLCLPDYVKHQIIRRWRHDFKSTDNDITIAAAKVSVVVNSWSDWLSDRRLELNKLKPHTMFILPCLMVLKSENAVDLCRGQRLLVITEVLYLRLLLYCGLTLTPLSAAQWGEPGD